jgi:hypothetical protein
MSFTEEVKLAVRIFRHVVPQDDFSPCDAMKWAGLIAEVADTDFCDREFANYKRFFEQKYGSPPSYQNDDDSVADRFDFIWKNMIPNALVGSKKKTQAWVMLLAGAVKTETKAGALYQRCHRKKTSTGAAKAVDINPIHILSFDSNEDLNDSQPVVSPPPK